MLDRTLAPSFADIVYQPIVEVDKTKTAGGIPLYSLDTPSVEVIKLELKLKCGIWYELTPSVSWFTAKMLLEGCQGRSAKEISEAFESLGAFIEIEPGFDFVKINVYGLHRNFQQVIDLLKEILLTPTFPVDELEILKQIRKDELALQFAKDNMHASKKIREAVFGLSHPYGRALQPEQVDVINVDLISEFYQNSFFNDPEIFVSGKLDENVLSLLSRLELPVVSLTALKDPRIVGTKEIIVERPESLQSSIRIAWPTINPSHADYFDFQVSNTILGGYFGSRLMKNIREEKGYTYGISSHPLHLQRSSFEIISTDVIAQYTQATLDEIWKEIEKLESGEINSEEIKMVTNYLAGKFESSINTPFQLMSKFKSLHKFGLDYGHYERYFDHLKSFEVGKLIYSIKKYFDPEKAHVVVVGKK